ncbi:hypothetical protein C2S52_014614 [Perilla frutescens var. hirtella]|nr:hypothetical protein C2S52_014614 [Perilla frutescens var. hirtella]
MEKRRKTEADDVEITLPEPIIQHIQSFLTGKEAAQTTILSKSWYSAWLTRPNLEFDQRDYWIRGFLHRYVFHESAKKTMKRYQELSLKIESFKIFMIDDFSVCNELIVNAMKMGAVDLCFETILSPFVLPHEVLESETLLRLSVTGYRIDAKVAWSSLESLILCRVCIEGDIIWDIISNCPLIEKLVLSECKFLVKPSPYSFNSSSRMLALNHSLINLYEFRKLKCLFLEKVKISSLFFSNFSIRFPCMKDLTVRHCFGYKEIQIYSPSLECITFSHKRILRAKFDVPSIRKFKFSGSNVPSLSFERASREWKSEISITWTRFSSSWFLKLNKLLGDLRRSKISLSLMIGCMSLESSRLREDAGLPKAIVEKLIMVAAPASVCSALLDGLFWCFHPKCIYQLWMPKSSTKDNELLEFLCKTLIQEGSENCCIPNQNRLALHDLEGVSVEIVDESIPMFLPLPWKMLLDASASPDNSRIVRFTLQWGVDSSRLIQY